MPIRVKKLIGAMVLLVLVIVYAILATAVATAYLGQSSGLIHLCYFLFTGVLWVVPAMVVIKWMESEPKPR